jgi:hypothetical protein
MHPTQLLYDMSCGSMRLLAWSLMLQVMRQRMRCSKQLMPWWHLHCKQAARYITTVCCWDGRYAEPRQQLSRCRCGIAAPWQQLPSTSFVKWHVLHAPSLLQVSSASGRSRPVLGAQPSSATSHEHAVKGGIPDVATAFEELRPRLALHYPFELDTFQVSDPPTLNLYQTLFETGETG